MDCEGSDDKYVFTFEWRIENFSHLQEVRYNYILDSLPFKGLTLDRRMWCLRLRPKGSYEFDKRVTLGLMLIERENFRDPINCEWSYVGSDGSALMTGTLRNQEIEWGQLLDLPHGPTQDQIFKTQRTAFLPLDCLTVRCRIWKSERNITIAEHVSANTRYEVREDSFIWAIEEFSSLELNQKVTHPFSPFRCPFLIGGLNVNLSLTGPSLTDSQADFEINIPRFPQPVHLRFNISLLDDDQNEVKCIEVKHTFSQSENSQTWIIPQFLSRQELLEKKGECLHHDTLTVLFKSYITSYSEFVNRSYRGQLDMKTRVLLKKSSIVKKESIQNSEQADLLDIFQNSSNSIVTLREDLLSMYRDQFMSDFELRSGDVSFKVHGNVLSARSPVFRTMFSGNMKEANSNSMDIPDIDCHTLKRMLTFLYAGTVEDLACESALKLYYAADKYQVSTLKQECSSVLRSGIRVSNVCDILGLADRHQDAQLTSSVYDFIQANFDEVLLSEEWGKFLLTDAYLAGITIRQVYKKKLQALTSQ